MIDPSNATVQVGHGFVVDEATVEESDLIGRDRGFSIPIHRPASGLVCGEQAVVPSGSTTTAHQCAICGSGIILIDVAVRPNRIRAKLIDHTVLRGVVSVDVNLMEGWKVVLSLKQGLKRFIQ